MNTIIETTFCYQSLINRIVFNYIIYTNSVIYLDNILYMTSEIVNKHQIFHDIVNIYQNKYIKINQSKRYINQETIKTRMFT